MSGLMILPYTEVDGAWERIISSASPESLQEFLETLGFEVSATRSPVGFTGLAGFNVRRGDIDGPREITLGESGWALYFEYLSDLDFYAGCCRWLRAHLPEGLALHLIAEAGEAFFEIDFDNVEEQIRRELILDEKS